MIGSTAAASQTGRRKRGRPRDETAEARITDAALRIYGERGLYGLNMNEIAHMADVSKGLLYSRYPNIEEALSAALDNTRRELPDSEGLTMKDALVTEGQRMAHVYMGPQGFALMRLWVDGRNGPDWIREIRVTLRTKWIDNLVHHVRGTVDFPDDLRGKDVLRLLELVEGAVFLHINSTPSEKWQRLEETVDSFVDDLVTQQLLLLDVVRRRGSEGVLNQA